MRGLEQDAPGLILLDVNLPGTNGFAFCQQVLGPERVLYAMDYPYQQSTDELAAYDRMAMTPEVKKMLMEDNARSVFRIRG